MASDRGPQLEDVVRLDGPVYVEPRWGYVITPAGRLITDAIRPNFSYRSPWRLELPSASSFVRMRATGRPVERHEAVISLRHWWEWNYHHFHLDVLGKLSLLDEIGIPEDIPLVVGNYVTELPFARELLTETAFARRNWLIQSENFVLADRIYYCHHPYSYRKKGQYIANLVSGRSESIDDRRVYLTRGRAGSRRLINEAEILAILSAFGFECVDTDGMNVREQATLFRNTRHLVAIHGAGLTNILFRDGLPLSILELRPETYQPGDFRRMSADYGYHWEDLAGSTEPGAEPQQADFFIRPEVLEKRLEAMLRGS